MQSLNKFYKYILHGYTYLWTYGQIDTYLRQDTGTYLRYQLRKFSNGRYLPVSTMLSLVGNMVCWYGTSKTHIKVGTSDQNFGDTQLGTVHIVRQVPVSGTQVNKPYQYGTVCTYYNESRLVPPYRMYRRLLVPTYYQQVNHNGRIMFTHRGTKISSCPFLHWLSFPARKQVPTDI